MKSFNVIAVLLVSLSFTFVNSVRAGDHPKYYDIVGFYKSEGNGVYVFRDLSTEGKLIYKQNVTNEVIGGYKTLNIDIDATEFESKYLYCSLGGRFSITNGMCNLTFNNGSYSFEQVGGIHCEWNCLRKDSVNQLLTEGKSMSKKNK